MVDVICSAKTCSKCGQSKPLAAFHKNPRSVDGRKSACADCLNARTKAWRVANPSYHSEKAKAAYYSNLDEHRARASTWRAENPERHKEYLATWRRDNAARVRANDAARLRLWKRNNRGAVNADKAKRRAAYENATPSWADFRAIRAIYKEAAAARKAGFDCHVDHIVPLVSKHVCGLHVPANLAVVGRKHNLQKSNKTWPNQP